MNINTELIAKAALEGGVNDCNCHIRSKSRKPSPFCHICRGAGKFTVCAVCSGAGWLGITNTTCPKCEGRGTFPFGKQDKARRPA